MAPGPEVDVLVCGLGPVGQLLSLLLGRAGVSVLAIDRASEPFDLPRAAVVDDEVLRIFQAAGVDREILAESQVQQEVSFVTAAGRPRTLLRPVEGSQGQPPLVSIHQPSIERTLLAALARQRSVRAERGRRLVRFEQRDLLREPPPAGPFHLVLCRNVLIYFDRASQERLFAAFRSALVPGGYLVLGKVETLLGDARLAYATVDARERVFRRN